MLGEFRKTFDISEYGNTVWIRFLFKLHICNTTTGKMIERMQEIEKLFAGELSGIAEICNFVPSGSDNWLTLMHDVITVQLNAGEIEFDTKQQAVEFCQTLEPLGYIKW